MREVEALERIGFLTQELNKHNYQYYVLDQPTISDYDFDMLMNELMLLEQTFPQYRQMDSPTQRVGGAVSKKFEQVKHKFPMLSLGNTYSEAEVADFIQRVNTDVIFRNSPIEFVCELKFDGVAISLWYEDGVLVKAVTRGDGIQGDDVLNNIKTIPSIPLKLNGDFPGSFEIRGEVILPHRSFEQLNIQRIENGDQPFANPRNAASGSLKLLDPKEVAKRKLDCFLYGVYSDEMGSNSHYEALSKAKEWGFKTSLPYSEIHSTPEAIFDYINRWDVARKTLPFDTDGAVVKVNDYDIQKQLGFTAKTPRWAVAYKYKAERVLTQLVSVDYQVGRTGAITPVANLVPVSLGGTIVKRATLHNADVMQNLNLHESDFVYLEKGGEIIPKIIAVELNQRAENATAIEFITHCPECGTLLVRTEGEAAYYCPNPNSCPPQIKGKLEHFISRKAMNIDSLGEGKIEMLFDHKMITNVADLYQLTYDKLIGLEKVISTDSTDRKIGFREKTVANILEALEKSKSVPFERVLFALGIRFVGETVARKIARALKNIEQINQATLEELTAIDDVGGQIAASVVEYFNTPENLEIINRLVAAGLQFEVVEATNTNNILDGKSFVVSGKFSISRDELKSLIELNGGKNVSSISSKTDFVVAGESMGPEKLKKAQSLGIAIISEEDFFQMIDHK